MNRTSQTLLLATLLLGVCQYGFSIPWLSANSADEQLRLKTSGESKPANSDVQIDNYESRYIIVNGTRLHYLAQGSGPPLVLIHGNPGSAKDWAPVFTQLSSHHKVIAFDRPGHGMSQRPKHGDATVEVQAQLIHDALAKLHVDRPIVVAHSWGAALTLVYAINYPKDVAAIAVIAPAVFESHDGDSFLMQIPSVPVIGDAANYMLTPLLGASVVRDGLKKAFSPDPVPDKYLNSALNDWTKPGRVRACAQDDATFNASLRKFSSRYAEISVPVSILVGDSDLVVSGEENALKLHQQLPNSHLTVFPRTGHEVQFTRPQEVVTEIQRLRRGLKSGRD